MSLKNHRDISFSVTAFSLKVIGVWWSDNRAQEWFRNATVVYSVYSLALCVCIQVRGLFFSWEDFEATTNLTCNILVAIMDLFKLCVLLVHKKKFFNLIKYMQRNFWHLNYDQYEGLIVADVKQTCIYFVCIFTFCTESTIFSYIMKPMISNIGRNESEREFLFNMWLDLPLYKSPYYEIVYVIQSLAVYQVGICYACFDNMLCIMCFHVAGQFRILRYRMTNLSKIRDKKEGNENQVIDSSSQCYATFKNYVVQHKALIEFCATIEEIFKVIALGQVLMFSILICFVGYQVVLVDMSLSSRAFYIFFLLTNMSQLWMFTYSCDCVIRESVAISSAVYAGPWIRLSMDKFGKMLRNDLQVVVMNSRRACCVTACGFFPISLETYTKIMSTAMSYFTLLRQRTVYEEYT